MEEMQKEMLKGLMEGLKKQLFPMKVCVMIYLDKEERLTLKVLSIESQGS